jgi:hypothetical protein
MMGKRVGLVFEAYTGLAGAIDAGNVAPLAVASANRIPNTPNLPTVAETLSGFESVGWQRSLRRRERRATSLPRPMPTQSKRYEIPTFEKSSPILVATIG